MPQSGQHTPFTGRRQELAALESRLGAASEGHGGVVLVAGEPGIGKSRLLAELSDRAAVNGWLVLAGRAYDSEGMPPYLPFVEALRGHVRRCPLDALHAQLGTGASEVALLVPEVRTRLPDLPASQPIAAEHERYRLFESVADFVLAIARAGVPGLLLVLDDLHWADKPTLLLLLHLARRCGEAPLLVVGAYRTTDLARTQPLAEVLAELRRERLADRIALGALPADDTTTLIAGLAAASPSPELAAAVYRETGGNAFFVEEVVRQLLAEGRDLGNAGHAVAEWELPEGVREVVGRRLSRLSAAANRLLQCAAVLGDGATTAVLTAVTGLAWTALTEVLEESVGAGMLREEAGGYSFTHALIQQTALEELSLPRRQRLHLEAAEAIEQMHAGNVTPHIAALASHFRSAGALAPPNKTLAYLQQAAEAAAGVFAWEEAVGHLQTALELLTAQGQGDTEQVCDLLLRLGDAQVRAEDRPAAQATYRRVVAVARTLPAPERLAHAAFGSSVEIPWGYVLDVAEVRALLEEAAAAIAIGDSALRVRLLAQLAVVTFDLRRVGEDWLARSQAFAEEAAAMAYRIGDVGTLLVALRAQQAMLWQPVHLERRRAIIVESIRLADAAEERESSLGARFWSLMTLLELGDRVTFDRELATFDQLSETSRLPTYRWKALVLRAMCALLEGRFTESERLAAEAEATGKGVHPEEAAFLHATQYFALCVQQGRLADWERVYYQALDGAGGPTLRKVDLHADDRGEWSNALVAYLHCEAGRVQAAVPLFARAAGSLPNTISETPDLYFLGLVAVPTCLALGDRRVAEAFYDCLLPAHEQNASPSYAPVCGPPVAYHLGLLATLLQRWEAAEQHFAFALAMNTQMRAEPYRAHTLRSWGEMLLARRQRGDLPRAQSLLSEGIALYDQLGMTYFAGKTRALLAEPGAVGAAAAHPDGLSEREVEVLRLVAAGKSNREVAALLVISVNTVFQHVRSILNKTGCSNRTEAAAYALRHGLVE